MFKCFIHNKGADKNCGVRADLQLCWSRGTYIFRRVVRFLQNMSRSRSKISIFCEKAKFHSEIVKLEDFSFQKDIWSDCS